MTKSEEIKVFISNRESKCGECGEELGRKAWITLDREKGALCLACGDLDHLVFLPAGDAAPFVNDLTVCPSASRNDNVSSSGASFSQ